MGWDWGGAGSGAMPGAGTGAMFGPWGAAAGGVAGGLLGGLKDKPEQKKEDFYGAAEKTSASSRPNTQNAFGGQTWGVGPDGRPTSSFNFTGQAANTMDSLQRGMGAAANYDPTQARDAAITSNYNQSMSRLNPRLQQQQGQFGAGMANSGLDPGTEAYNNANQQLQQGQNDSLQTAMAGAIRQGNETQDTQMRQMNQPFSQANQMMGMLGQQGQTGQGADYNKAAYYTQKMNDDSFDQQQAKEQGKKSGAGGMLGSLGGKK